MIKIVAAETDETLPHVLTLAREYITWMLAEVQAHYPALDIPEFTAAHDYDDIQRKFPGEHVPPYGRLYVAYSGDAAGGCIALGKLSDQFCEMRTLYVRPEFRGLGMGKQLVETLLDDARAIGYSHMRLDTLAFMDSALTLYRSLGFRDIAPYANVSDSLRQYIRFLELTL